MAIQLSITQSGSKVEVWATNQGSHAVIIDQIDLRFVRPADTSILFVTQDHFEGGDGRLGAGHGGFMFDITYQGGPGHAVAKAHYWEVDQVAQSAVIDLS
jgi:hypothetical protein